MHTLDGGLDGSDGDTEPLAPLALDEDVIETKWARSDNFSSLSLQLCLNSSILLRKFIKALA